uniref:Ubiquitin carboxyl-terminal hydrolase n=1 Tax=Blastobotrys adeninivorans TaxID=409370 RepID=A0A060SZI5_BLAAD
MDFCRARSLLYDTIPNHEDYEKFASKGPKSPFYESYLTLKDLIEKETAIKQIEQYLDLRAKGTAASKSPQSKPKKIPRKPVASDLDSDSSSVSDINGDISHDKQNTNVHSIQIDENGHTKDVKEHVVADKDSSEPQDALAARFARLRTVPKGPRQVPQSLQPQRPSGQITKHIQNGHGGQDHVHNSHQNGHYDHHDSPEQPHYDSAYIESTHKKVKSLDIPVPQFPPPAPPVQSVPSAPAPAVVFPRATVINAETLCHYLKTIPEQVLILDVRDRTSFECGHIRSTNIVCVEPITLRSGMNDQDLEDTLILNPQTEQEAFASRGDYEVVVYYDQNSTEVARTGDQSILHCLTQAVYNNAFTVPLKRAPCLLVGGYDTWHEDMGEQWIVRTRTSPLPPPDPPTVPVQNGSVNGTRLPYPVYARDMNDYFSRTPGNAYDMRDSGPSHIRQQQSDAHRVNSTPALHSIPQQHHYRPEHAGSYQQRPAPVYSTKPSNPSPAYSPQNQPYASPQQQQQQQQTIRYPPPPQPATAPPAGRQMIPQQHHKAPPNPVLYAAADFTTGLQNLGNTCYMNCIIQCLAGTVPLAVIFADGSYRKFVNVNSKLGYKGVLVQRFAELVQTMLQGSIAYMGPIALKDLSGRLRDTFRGNEQQDCCEFLTFIMDGLHEELNANGDKKRLKELTADEERRREGMSVRVASTIEWERYLKSDFSPIVETFQGQYQSKLQCLTCGYTSTTYSAFSCLSLPIPLNYQNVSIKDCFDLFTATEVLDGEDAWHCAKCKAQRRSIKTLKISRLPHILILHLKRFHHYRTSAGKLETFVTYPVNGLNLTDYWPQYTGDDQKRLEKMPLRGQYSPFVYDLYGVANHFGTLKGGHYTSFVRKASKGWCYFDDVRVTFNVNPQNVVNKNAYVLFYQRRS